MVNEKHGIVITRGVSEDQWGSVELSVGVDVKLDYLKENGTQQLYDDLFDTITALIKEGLVREELNEKLRPE